MAPLKDWLDGGGALLRLRLARAKANIVDAQMIAALHGALVAHGSNSALRGVLLDAEGQVLEIDEHGRGLQLGARREIDRHAKVPMESPRIVSARGGARQARRARRPPRALRRARRRARANRGCRRASG